MLLGGVEVQVQNVGRLATLVGRPLSDKLERAIMFRSEVIGLSPEETRSILSALERAGDLAELRQRLLANARWASAAAVRG